MFKLKTKENLAKIIEYGIYLLIFLLPFGTRLILKSGELNDGFWEYGTYSLYLVDIVSIVIVMFGLEYFAEHVFEKIKFSQNKWLFASLAFLIWLGINLIFSIDNLLSLYWLVRFFIALNLFLIINFIKPKLRNVALIFMSTGLIQSILAIWQFASQKVWACKWLGMSSQSPLDLGVSVVEIGDERWLRSYGSFSHPNVLGGFLVIAIILTVYLATNYKYPIKFKHKEINPVIFNFFLPVLLIGLALTFSRTAIMSLVVALIFIFGFIFIKNRRELVDFKKTGLVLIACAIAFGVILSPFIKQRLNFSAELEKNSIEDRQTQFDVSGELIQPKILTGNGLGNFTLAWYQSDLSLESWQYQPIHNQYFLILAELGIIGLILFLAILVLKFFGIKKYNRTAIFKIGILMSLIVISILDHYLWTSNSGLIWFWLVMGMV